jgi:enoyl-CoA hydratase/carnithine racemase
MSDLAVTRDGAVATLVLDRPEVKNAFTLSMMDECARLVRELDRDPGVRAIVLTGAGDAFCSGIELSALAAVEDEPVAHKAMLVDHVHPALLAIHDSATPVIAALNGAAVGAGLDMALACHLRIAAASARMSEGYIRVGLVPGDGGCWFLPRLVGLGRALDLLMTGRFIGAEEAERIGMVGEVVPDEELRARARSVAERLAALPSTQLAMIARAARGSATQDLRSHLDLMSSHLGVVMATPGVQELLDSRR